MGNCAVLYVISRNACVLAPPKRGALPLSGEDMPTRDELVEALHHATETRARLKQQPGQHGQRALILNLIDDLLDELAEVEAESVNA